MKLSFARKAAVGALLFTILLAQGCAYTAVTKKDEIPALGPQVQTRLTAVMPEVKDMRVWPVAAPDTRIAYVRLFPKQITDHLRQGLVNQGLFAALPAPGPKASTIKTKLLVTVQSFSLDEVGKNAWVVPHLFVDGLILPIFTLAALGTKGDVDLGGYLIPSTKMGTTLNVNVVCKDGRRAILDRSYLIELPLGAVSQRKLFESVYEPLTHGAQVSKTEGLKALDELAETMARDPYWAYLTQFKRVVLAERAGGGSRPLDKRVRAVKSVMGMLKPLAFAPDVTTVLRDGALEAEMRAGIVNDIRARRLGLDDPEKLPPGRIVDEEKAKALFDEPSVERAMVQAELINRVLDLAVKVLTPPAPAEPKPEKEKEALSGEGPPTEQAEAKEEKEESKIMEPPNAAELRAELRQKLANKLKGKPNVQVVLLGLADKAVGSAWKPMLALLEDLDSPIIKEYLKHRQGLG